MRMPDFRGLTVEKYELFDAAADAAELQRTLQSASTAFSYFDSSDRLQYWNRAYEDLNFQIRPMIRKGALFPDLLAELVVRNQIRIEGSRHEWVSERLAARRYGSTAFRALSDGRTFLVQERKDDVGGTLGFWVSVTDLVSAGALKGMPSHLGGIRHTLADQGQQLLLRDKLQTVISCLDVLRLGSTSAEDNCIIDQATSATQDLRELLDLLR